MIYFHLFVCAVLGVFEFFGLKKNAGKKEFAVFAFLLLFAAVYGVVYFANPWQRSLTNYLFEFLKIEG